MSSVIQVIIIFREMLTLCYECVHTNTPHLSFQSME